MASRSCDAVKRYLQELSSRVVAETGVVRDTYHMGKILLKCLQDAPDFIQQINGATDEQRTAKTMMESSILCASAFTNLGFMRDDVIVVMSRIHNDLPIPMYAALYLGITYTGVDAFLGVNELSDVLKLIVPKAIFCENYNVKVVEETVKLLNISPYIVILDEKRDHMSFTEFLEKFSKPTTIENFKPADFEPETTTAVLVMTSGSTGQPKAVPLSHKNIYFGFGNVLMGFDTYPTPFQASLLVCPIQWVATFFNLVMSPILRFTLLQTPLAYTRDHIHSMINKYRPEFLIITPALMTTLINAEYRQKCDFTCLKYILIAGSVVSVDLLNEIKKISPNTVATNVYGISECCGVISNPAYSYNGSLGMLHTTYQFKIVDPETKKEILEPNTPGELYLRGPSVIKGYYKNPELTAQAFEDGWFKTGDILYRDEYHQMYYVDRLKLLLKYRTYHVSPIEIENVVRKHPGVLDVVVSGVPDDECGDLPIAFVIPREEYNVTEQDIKDLVKVSLTDTKQLRGGVVFMKEFPVTTTAKIDRTALKKMAANRK